MNTRILSIIISIIGQGIIIAGFLLFRGNTPNNILWLDIIVSSIVYWSIAANMIGPALIPIDDPAGSSGGGLGIKWVAQLTYALLSIGVMVTCGLMAWNGQPIAFKWQAIIQAGLLFLLLAGLLASRSATEKVAAVHDSRRQAMSGKEDLRYAMADLAHIASVNPGVPPAVTTRLRQLSDLTRYITPSASPAAAAIERQIFSYANNLRSTLEAYGMNAPDIERTIDLLSAELDRRKTVF